MGRQQKLTIARMGGDPNRAEDIGWGLFDLQPAQRHWLVIFAIEHSHQLADFFWSNV